MYGLYTIMHHSHAQQFIHNLIKVLLKPNIKTQLKEKLERDS